MASSDSDRQIVVPEISGTMPRERTSAAMSGTCRRGARLGRTPRSASRWSDPYGPHRAVRFIVVGSHNDDPTGMTGKCRVVSVALPGHPSRIGRDGRYRSVTRRQGVAACGDHRHVRSLSTAEFGRSFWAGRGSPRVTPNGSSGRQTRWLHLLRDERRFVCSWLRLVAVGLQAWFQCTGTSFLGPKRSGSSRDMQASRVGHHHDLNS